MSGKLTAEQVMAIVGRYQPAYCPYTNGRFDWQGIADELNATLGAWTCHNIDDDYDSYFECSECGCHVVCNFYGSGYDEPRFCPLCGRKVEG